MSPDSPRKHVKFREKYGLPLALLSDEAHEVADQYGTWVEKSRYGRTYMGMERTTVVIDADGNVATVMRKVKPADHADDVLAALSSIQHRRTTWQSVQAKRSFWRRAKDGRSTWAHSG